MQKENNPLVSIIIPTYNRAHLILETLKSVQNQTYRNWECIVVDDGSTDNTEIIIQVFCKANPGFKYFRKINGGSASARNIGLKNCVGEFIQFLDDDDYMYPDKLSLSLDKFLKDDSLSVVVTNFKMFTDDIQTPQPAYCELKQNYLSLESVLFGWDDYFTIPIHCGLFKGTLLEGFTYNENVRAKEDWIMWVSIFLKGAIGKYDDRTLVLYRNHLKSKTKNSALITENIHKTYKYLLDILPEDISLKFSKKLLDNYNEIIKIKENERMQVYERIKIIMDSRAYIIANIFFGIKNKIKSVLSSKNDLD